MQLGTRTPVAIAQTAITLSDGRFPLGLGASEPPVIEGLHGTSFARSATRMRETVEIIRQAFTGDKTSYSGRELTMPAPAAKPSPCSCRRARTTPPRATWPRSHPECSG